MSAIEAEFRSAQATALPPELPDQTNLGSFQVLTSPPAEQPQEVITVHDKVGGRRTTYEVRPGTNDEPPLLYAVGWGTPLAAATPLSSALQKAGNTVVTLEQRHLDMERLTPGRLLDLNHEYSVASGDVLRSVRRQFGWSSFDILAHSRGSSPTKEAATYLNNHHDFDISVRRHIALSGADTTNHGFWKTVQHFPPVFVSMLPRLIQATLNSNPSHGVAM